MYKIPANTLFVGKKLVYVPECHSTNSLASDLCQHTNAVDGTVIVTDNQTKGRGQRGNKWFSEPYKNLTFSVIVKPSFLLPINQFKLTMVVSLALRDFLAHRLKNKVSIKWPNDIFVNAKKVCGILIENVLAGNTIQYSIIGIGLNVNQELFLMNNVDSMKNISSRTFELAEELELLLEFLESRYLQLRSGNDPMLKEHYTYALYCRDEPKKFEDAEGQFIGTIIDVNDQGKLLIQTPEAIRSYELKQVRMLD